MAGAGLQSLRRLLLTDEFAAAFNDLAALAAKRRTAVMCAEILPWRCHRRILADRFVTLGWNVVDVMKAGQIKPHELPPFASVIEGRLTYPG
jgi:uncharacterized protein (DUF488 family)